MKLDVVLGLQWGDEGKVKSWTYLPEGILQSPDSRVVRMQVIHSISTDTISW